MVKSGAKYLKKNKLEHCRLEDIEEIIKKGDKECLVLIGVLEHLENPNKILKLFKLSKFRYLFLSLPLFSFSTILEHVFQNIYPRQLGGLILTFTLKSQLIILQKNINLKL